MPDREKPEIVEDAALEPAEGGGVFQTPAGGWGADARVMGKGPIPNMLDAAGEPVTRHVDLTTRTHS